MFLVIKQATVSLHLIGAGVTADGVPMVTGAGCWLRYRGVCGCEHFLLFFTASVVLQLYAQTVDGGIPLLSASFILVTFS